jgi:phage terminase large subunit-like protein
VPKADVERGDGDSIIAGMETFCTVSRDGFAGRGGQPLVLRDWQKELIRHLFARRPDGRMRHRTGLIGLPRKNGKSSLGSGLALDGLLFGGQGAEVYSAAAEEKQARIVFSETKRMVQADPELSDACEVMRDVIGMPATGSIYRVLTAKAPTKEGLNPTRVIVDELHAHPHDELWNVLTLGSGARLDPLTLAITTAGVMYDSLGQESICYRLYKHGVELSNGYTEDPSFFFAWWGAPEGADHLDPAVWEAANPAYGDLIDPDDFAAAVVTTPENEYRTKRLNQWVSAAAAWLPAGAWEDCGDVVRTIPDGADVVLGFDGSYNNDSTGLVVCTVGDDPLMDVVWASERPKNAPQDWVVPIDEAEDAIRKACKRWHVLEVACDPSRWARSMQVLEAERLPMVEFPQSGSRMIPATERFYEAVMNRTLTHTGNPDLARHIGNAVIRRTTHGGHLQKDAKGSPRKIDLAVCAVMALDRASFNVRVIPRIVSLSAALDAAEES